MEVADDGLAISANGADAAAVLFQPSGDVTAGDIAAHEDRVLATLAGETQEGREELDILESEIGPIDDVELAGTVFAEGELRTYVNVVAGSESITLWYAIDEGGGIAGVDGPTDPPDLRLVPSGDGDFRPEDPTGSGLELTVTFEDGRMTVSGPETTTTTAERS